MIRSIIIDDELHCIRALEHELELYCPDVKVIATCQSGQDGIEAIIKHKPELVFLDISMPLMTGFEMLEKLESSDGIKVIFVTAYDQYVLKALRASALDYLLKPIDSEQLMEAIERVKQIGNSMRYSDRIHNLISNKELQPEKQKIALRNKDGFDFVNVCDILYCRAEGSYTEIFFRGGRKLLVSRSLGEIETNLPESIFERIHNSTIINISHVIQFSRNDGLFVVMENGDALSISRPKKDLLLARLGIN